MRGNPRKSEEVSKLRAKVIKKEVVSVSWTGFS